MYNNNLFHNRTVLKHLACNDLQLCIERTRLMRVDIRQSNNSRINSSAFSFLEKVVLFSEIFSNLFTVVSLYFNKSSHKL